MSQPLRVSEILLRELDDNGILHLSLNDAMRRNWLFADTPRGRGRAGSGALGRAGSDHGNPLKVGQSGVGPRQSIETNRVGIPQASRIELRGAFLAGENAPLRPCASAYGPTQLHAFFSTQMRPLSARTD